MKMVVGLDTDKEKSKNQDLEKKELMVKKKEKNKQEARSGKKQYYTDYFKQNKTN